MTVTRSCDVERSCLYLSVDLSERGAIKLVFDCHWAQDGIYLLLMLYPQKLVAATALLKSGLPNHWKFFEVGWNLLPQFSRQHIPGARYLDTGLLEEGPLWKKRSDSQLLKALLDLGITSTTPVLLYSRDTIAAARALQLMMYAGVEDVRLLDGGLTAWRSAGGEVTATTDAPYAPALSFGTTFPAHPEYIIDLKTALEMANDKENSVLVSVRTWREHIGEISGYESIKKKGDVPGAVWGRAGSTDVYSMDSYRNPDQTMVAPNVIQKFWREAGIVPEKRIAFYCGTSWRASEAFFYAYIMGWPRISVYDGGWAEYSALNP